MMKMKGFLFSAMMAVCLVAAVSCEEHTDIYDNRVSVGNILLSDNTLISPYGYDSCCHQAVGVVFYTNRDTALVVGLKELGEYQYTDSLAQSRRSCSMILLCQAGLCRRLVSFVPCRRTCLLYAVRWR